MRREMDEIIEEYTKKLYRIAYFNVKVKTDAEDIVQEVFIKYMTNKKEFEDKEHEKRWLIRVTINLCKNFSKSAWNRHVVSVEKNYPNLETQEQYQILEELDKLKDKYKIVVQLFYYEDLSVESISKILNISETNVRTRLKRAREKLKIEIERGYALYGQI